MMRTFMPLMACLALLASPLHAQTAQTSPPAAETPLPAPAAEPAPEAQPAPEAEPPAVLESAIGQLKEDIVALNRDLFMLEEELLFPANTQVAVFVSMDVGSFFAIDSIQLRVDDKQVANYLYTPREAEALLKGGVHRLHLGNLKLGRHQLVAFFNGKGPNGMDYSRGASLEFEKGIGAKYLELRISDRQRSQQPEFEIKDWE